MLDMIELYGLVDESGDHWSNISTADVPAKQLEHLIKWSAISLPLASGSEEATLLWADCIVDERFRLGRWCDGGEPQILELGLMTGNGHFAFKLAAVETQLFLMPPVEMWSDLSDGKPLKPSKPRLALADSMHLNTPLYW